MIVTLAFLIVLILSTLLSTSMNMYLYKVSFSESLHFSLYIELGTRKMIVIAALISGFAAALFLDYRLKKENSQNQN
ncbi:hypothetical protein [Bacillus taeanensis]|uniref:Uncharacterized protein n=1 Tax=Bacillus taeanensis TaxID=273032 RepID=A0A366XRH6_9BACI|nr:hypothetical protein [Bacillus taeanensis]RBW68497.1 hypothetical protein DS031_16100 [Bacillus taeanensis]